MIKDKLIIIPYNLPQKWICDYIRQTHNILCKKNVVFRFLWNEALSFKEIILALVKNNKKKKKFKFISRKSSLITFTPIHFLPFRRFNFIAKINLLINILIIQILFFLDKNLCRRDKILWLFHPENENFVNKFKEKLSIYDCIDFFASLDPDEDKIRKKTEKKLLKKVDVVFANSPSLYLLKKNLHSRVFKVPQGCNTDLFLKRKRYKRPQKLLNILHPQIGFIGNIDYRLDFNLIKKLSLTQPAWSFIFIGPVWQDIKQDKLIKTTEKLNDLEKIKNIHFLGTINKNTLIKYIDCFDIAIIPYNIKLEFCRYSYPMKVFEYFCRSKPVVSTPIESLIPLQPYVAIARNAEGFEKEIKKILECGWSNKYKREQKKLAIANSWEAKIEKISEILDTERC